MLNKYLSIIYVLLGAGMEYYCYMLFALMIPVISPVFNAPQGNILTGGLTAGYFIVFLGAIMRPIGGIVIGYIGDKKGRSVALFWSMILMAVSSILLVFLPSYKQIGIWASIGLFAIRSLQTMSAASELNGSGIFLIETMNEKNYNKAGLASGLAWSFTVLGMFAGAIASYYSTPTNWKFAFIIGSFIAFIALFLKFSKKAHQSDIQENQVVLFNFYQSVICTILIACGISGMFYYNMIWYTGWMQTQIDPITVKFFSMIYFAIYSIALLVSGILFDLVENKSRLLLASPIILSLLAIPEMYYRDLYLHIFSVVVLSIYVGSSHAVLFKLFPKKYRYRGVSICYSIGTSIIGGITSWICMCFVSMNHIYPAFWLIFVCMLAFLGVFFSRKNLQ